MIVRKYRGRRAAYLTKRDLLRLSLACVVVLVAATTWRQAVVGSDIEVNQQGAAGYEQITTAPGARHGPDINASCKRP